VRDPAVLEQVDHCRTIVLDKAGTLTYGKPTLTDRLMAPGFGDLTVLQLVASLERYSKHPLAAPILDAARTHQLKLLDAVEASERPGEGLAGTVDGHQVRIVGRRYLEAQELGTKLPDPTAGLECVIVIDGAYAATYRFHDVAREDSRPFINHLAPRHHVDRVLLVSGDREPEVRYLADLVGITEIHAGQSPEDKVAITRAEVARAPSLFIGDGINDAPALMTATIGIAFVAGAVFQEIIDLAAVLNALRTALPGGRAHRLLKTTLWMVPNKLHVHKGRMPSQPLGQPCALRKFSHLICRNSRQSPAIPQKAGAFSIDGSGRRWH
jgi:P-type E1-E2 ATPase